MTIETNFKITVLADVDYCYVVTVSDTLSVEYHEKDSDSIHRISFGSKEELRAVANAMLKAANF